MDEFREHVKIEEGLLKMPIANQQEFLSEIMIGPYVSREIGDMLKQEIFDHGWETSIVKSAIAEQPFFLTKY